MNAVQYDKGGDSEFNYWTKAWLVMVIHYLTNFLQEAGVQSSSLDSRFRDILKKIEDLVIRDETRARIKFENKECSRAV